MPYQTVSQLPKAQVKGYSGHQRKAFMDAFNNALTEYHGNEHVAFAVAHAAAQKASVKKPKAAKK